MAQLIHNNKIPTKTNQKQKKTEIFLGLKFQNGQKRNKKMLFYVEFVLTL